MTADTGFSFRLRREPGEPPTELRAGESVRWDEHLEYVLMLPRELKASELEALVDIGFEVVTPTSGMISFGNFVGRANILGVLVDVVSKKLGPDGASGLLAEVVHTAADLVYGWAAPTGFAASWTVAGSRQPVPYHQLLYLVHAMRETAMGDRLQDAFGVIAQAPTQRFEMSHPVVEVGRVRTVDRRMVSDLFARPERLTEVGTTSPWYAHPLAEMLESRDEIARRFFPLTVSAPRTRLVFDTPENRFVKYLIGECLTIVGRFVEHPALHRSLRRACRELLTELEAMAATEFLQGIGQLSPSFSPTQALAKLPGYRELFQVYIALLAQPTLPDNAGETQRFLDGKDVAQLYEYWVFLATVDAVARARGRPGPMTIASRPAELSVLIPNGLEVEIEPSIRVTYNQTFPHRPLDASYSTPLRPDVTLWVGDQAHVFDAKYRLQRIATGDSSKELDELEAEERRGATFKRADLYKMHTYHDAIAPVRSAWVVYPGDDFLFFEVGAGRRTDRGAVGEYHGVGAVPLCPDRFEDADRLRALVADLIARARDAP